MQLFYTATAIFFGQRGSKRRNLLILEIPNGAQSAFICFIGGMWQQ